MACKRRAQEADGPQLFEYWRRRPFAYGLAEFVLGPMQVTVFESAIFKWGRRQKTIRLLAWREHEEGRQMAILRFS